MFFSRHSSPIFFPTSSAAPCNMGTSIYYGTSDFHTRNVRQYWASIRLHPRSLAERVQKCCIESSPRLTLSAPNFPPSCSLMSGDKVDVEQSVLPMLSSITCGKHWHSSEGRTCMLKDGWGCIKFWPNPRSWVLYGLPGRRCAGLICTQQGEASRPSPGSACQVQGLALPWLIPLPSRAGALLAEVILSHKFLSDRVANAHLSPNAGMPPLSPLLLGGLSPLAPKLFPSPCVMHTAQRS